MRIFDHPNTTAGWKCPICGKNDDKPVILVGVDGTGSGNIEQAEQVHADCLRLRITQLPDDQRIIYQVL